MLILKKLKVINFVIIEQIEVNFAEGFNIITGETGTGKSIVINALNMALGYKADISRIRSGAKESEIEAIFEINRKLPSKLSNIFAKNKINHNSNFLALKRKLYSSGRSTAAVNNKSCSINLLKSIGYHLVDMHGQHAHQQLLNPDTHIEYLDNFGNYQESILSLKENFNEIQNKKSHLDILIQKQQLNKEKRELWQFQFDEISKLRPLEDEIKDLEKEQNLLNNAERYHKIANNLNEHLYEGEITLYSQLQDVINHVKELDSINPEFNEYLESLGQLKFLIQELANDVSGSSHKIEFNPIRLEEINNRLFDLYKLIKKYNKDIPEILKYQAELEINLNLDGSLDFDIKKVQKELESLIIRHHQLEDKISKQRRQTAIKFQQKVESQLFRLGFKNSKFQVNFTKTQKDSCLICINESKYYPTSSGYDRTEFYIQTNPGEPLTPLVETVSGGEVSRIMLAMKTIMASGDNIPVLIFDEIDTGISGQIARIVGEEMLALSKNHQILCITHLPQVASLGKAHLCVKKRIEANRSAIFMEMLTHNDRIEEIAKLIGGKEITNTGRNQARELLENS